MRSFPPALPERKQHIPLYIAEAQNEAICTTRHTLSGSSRDARSKREKLAYRKDAATVVVLLLLPQLAVVSIAASFGPVARHAIV